MAADVAARSDLLPDCCRLAVIGLGYIGLSTAVLFASKAKLEVLGVDTSSHVVDAVNAGTAHFAEPGLNALLSKVVNDGRLRATFAPEPAEAFIIAVPTPFLRPPPGDGASADPMADLTCVRKAAESIAPVLKSGDLVILESTVPVGTTERLLGWLAAARPDLDFGEGPDPAGIVHIAHCPERVLPGRMLHELLHNDRVVGGVTRVAARKAADLYGTILKDGSRCFLASNSRTAELCKLAENSFRDCNIAFANELSMICDQLGGVDVWEVVRLANLHPRVSILHPGPGVGGHCIAVDPWFIVESVKSKGAEVPRLIRTARLVNEAKRDWVVTQLKALVFDALTDRMSGASTLRASPQGATLADVTIACLGLAYKPDADDLRGSPALEVARAAASWGCPVLAVEPNLKALPPQLTDSSRLRVKLTSLSEALAEADVVCILVAHRDFVGSVTKETVQSGHARHILDTVGLLSRRD